MAFIPTPGAVKVDIMFLMSGQQVHNVIWCSRDTTWTQEQREALNDAVAAWWEAQKSNFSTSISLAQVESINQESASAPASTLVISPPSSGSASGVGPNNGTALVATLRTDQRGRNYRGRMYIAGHRATDVQDTLNSTSAHVASLLIALQALKTAIEALGAVWVVVSKYINKIPRANGLKTPITAITMDTLWDSQRRRLGGRGV